MKEKIINKKFMRRRIYGIILASPVHYSAIAGTMKSFLDRAFLVTSVNNGMLRHKVGASVVAVRRAGGVPAFEQLNNYINYSEMVMPTSNYWNVVYGTDPGEAVQDKEGIQTMSVLGKNMAWLMKSIDFAKDHILRWNLKIFMKILHKLKFLNDASLNVSFKNFRQLF